MNKSELVSVLKDRLDVTKVLAHEIVNAFTDVIVTEVATGESGEVVLPGFGKFSRKVRAARKSRNPRSGETVDVPAKRVVKFRVGSEFKDSVLNAS